MYLHFLQSASLCAIKDHVLDIFEKDIGLVSLHGALRAEYDAMLATDSA